MFPIADQTAGPIGLIFFVDTHGWIYLPLAHHSRHEKQCKNKIKFLVQICNLVILLVFNFYSERKPDCFI